jgi:hypothetical protein
MPTAKEIETAAIRAERRRGMPRRADIATALLRVLVDRVAAADEAATGALVRDAIRGMMCRFDDADAERKVRAMVEKRRPLAGWRRVG